LKKESAMYRSPSTLPESARQQIAAALNVRLADGLDLHSQMKVAHWNIKGPHFAALHPLFETFATTLAEQNDATAERAVALGALAYGTARHVALASSIPEYPDGTTRDLEHVRALADRIDQHLKGLKESRKTAQGLGDDDTVDLLTGFIGEWEKSGWFLRASLEG
jgi:starvation-inducible DNA-binding protein